MTKEEIKKLKQTVDYFGHWYDVIGEERVAILEKAVNELEATKELQEENEELQQKYLSESYEKAKLVKQIEKMKSDVKGNLRFAEHSNNEIMRQKMCSMLLQWEARYK